MKRVALKRRTPLVRKSLLRTRAKPRSFDPLREEWKRPAFGRCAVCGQLGWLVRHHVIYAQHVRRVDPSLEFDPRNAMGLGRDCSCHELHHAASRRIPVEKLPEAALAFAVDLLGEKPCAVYLRRYYA